MKTLFTILMAILLTSCSKFNKSVFVEKSFGLDLSPYVASHKSDYIDGRLDIYGVGPESALYRQVFGNRSAFYTSADVVIEGAGPAIRAHKSGNLYYRILGSFDGYVRTIVYAPEEKRMVFLYADIIF